MPELTQEEIDEWRRDKTELTAALQEIRKRLETTDPATLAAELADLKTTLAELKQAAPDPADKATLAALQTQIADLTKKLEALPPSKKGNADDPPDPRPDPDPDPPSKTKPTVADKHGWL